MWGKKKTFTSNGGIYFGPWHYQQHVLEEKESDRKSQTEGDVFSKFPLYYQVSLSLSTPTCFRHTSLSQTGGHGVFEFKISGRNRIKRKNGFTQMCIGNQAHHQYSLAQNRTKPKENVEREIINGSHK